MNFNQMKQTLNVGKIVQLSKKLHLEFSMIKYKIGRSAITGEFTTVKKAMERPTTHTVETIIIRK